MNESYFYGQRFKDPSFFSTHIWYFTKQFIKYNSKESQEMKYLEIYTGGNKALIVMQVLRSTSAWNKMKLNTEQLHMPCYNLVFLFSIRSSGFHLVAAHLWTIFLKTINSLFNSHFYLSNDVQTLHPRF